ncbi:MAG: PEGA domain-containing protein [Acidobacteria bacterium]|nr:PEGA domain-containing protein [Acidobacteriota bacterium]
MASKSPSRPGRPSWLRLALMVCALAISSLARTGTAVQDPSALGSDPLAEARRLADMGEHDKAVPLLDDLISKLEAQDGGNTAAVHTVLVSAYELRGRSRFVGLRDTEGARADFTTLLRRDPGHALAQPVSPKISDFFREVRKGLVAEIALSVTPQDAQVELDGRSVTTSSAPLAVVAGPHTIVAKAPGYQAVTEQISAAAGTSTPLGITLTRVSSTALLVTVPSGVEVFVDGAKAGVTATGPPPAQYSDWATRLGEPLEKFSAPYIVADLSNGDHLLELRKECYESLQRTVAVTQPSDYKLEPLKLDPAVGSIAVSSTPAGGNVFLDGQAKGKTPLSLDVCKGDHTVEVRSPSGRFVRRLQVKSGDTLTLEGMLKPAFALLSVSGLPPNLRGAPDFRREVERIIGDAATIAFVAPPPEEVERALKDQKVPAGWLTFTRGGRPVGEAANFTPDARLNLSRQIATQLDAQGVGAVTIPPNAATGQLLVSILAAGSSQPDVLELRLDDPASRDRLIARLSDVPPLLRPSAGLVAIDVADVPGAVIITVEPNTDAATVGLVPGDVIQRANGQNITDASGFEKLLAGLKPDTRLSLELRTRDGAAKTADLRVSASPRAVYMEDQTLLFNKLILDFRTRLAGPLASIEEAAARLNLAIALMAAGNWDDARSELERVKLADVVGVSNGTVQYLTGLCHEKLGQLAEAERAWRAASAAKDSLLTEDGPPVKELADRKLAELQRAGRRSGGRF